MHEIQINGHGETVKAGYRSQLATAQFEMKCEMKAEYERLVSQAEIYSAMIWAWGLAGEIIEIWISEPMANA